MKNRKGVSDIVVTILLVLLSLAAITIVWGFIRGQLTGSESEIQKAESCRQLKLEPISCDVNGEFATVKYKLGASSTPLAGVSVLIEKVDGSSTPEAVDISYVPEELETVVYTTSVAAGDANKFSVAGTVMVGTKEVICEETAKIECK